MALPVHVCYSRLVCHGPPSVGGCDRCQRGRHSPSTGFWRVGQRVPVSGPGQWPGPRWQRSSETEVPGENEVCLHPQCQVHHTMLKLQTCLLLMLPQVRPEWPSQRYKGQRIWLKFYMHIVHTKKQMYIHSKSQLYSTFQREFIIN